MMDDRQIKAIQSQVAWLESLIAQVKIASKNPSENKNNSGTIYNLCPEISKGASKLRKLVRWDWESKYPPHGVL